MLYIARRAPRKAVYLPMGQVSQNPSLIFPLVKTSQGELEDLVRAELSKQRITSESEVQAIVDKGEEEYEKRIKVAEARKEVRRLMGLRSEGKKLMQVGFRKWKEVYYPATKRFKGE